jgi:hypothetical protein
MNLAVVCRYPHAVVILQSISDESGPIEGPIVNTENRDAFYSLYAQYLKDRGLQFTKSGSKSNYNKKHAIDPSTGYWIHPNYSGSKPIRWLVHIDPFSTPIKAFVPNEHRANRLGHSNRSGASARRSRR